MYLKVLEIQGFKSFPEKIRLTFERNITAIVGPNGSGKSNISDAILWVMGEGSAKTLRGGKMEDVIFGGTERRPPLGFAQVSLIIDNSDGIFNTDNSEVMITRRYYRSGDSEYYINRRAVRLRDIHELLMDTGLGRDGYSIIGQGRIAEIVSAKSADRREIFEEAAGISRFRYRKEEAERKLRRTDENLVRINDKLEELELQVGPLKKQAETAKRFLVLRDELRLLEVSVWLENLERLKAQAEAVTADYEEARTKLEVGNRELAEIYAASENLTEKMRELDIEAERRRTALREAEQQVSEAEGVAAVLRANIANNCENIDRIRAEMEEQLGRSRSLDDQIAERRRRIEAIDRDGIEINLKIRETIQRFEEKTRSSDELSARLRELVARENGVMNETTELRTRLSMLTEAAQELMDRDSSLEAEMFAASERAETAQRELLEAGGALKAAAEKRQELQNIASGHTMRVSSRENRAAELMDRHTRLTVEVRTMDSRIKMLSDMEREFEGFTGAVKSVMREARRGAVRGVHGPVANLIRVEDRYAVAIETALGAAMQSVIVDTPEDGRAAIEYLKRRDAGRATFLPLSTIRGRYLDREPSGDEGYLGAASELVACDDQYMGIIANLLGRTAVTETLSDAIRLQKKYGNGLRIVSLDGQLMNPGGSMTGGSASRNSGILSRANELKKLGAQREGLGNNLRELQAALSEAQRELEAAKYELEVLRRELTEEMEKVHRCDSAVSQCKLLLEAAANAALQLGEEKKTLRQRDADNTRQIGEAKAGLEVLAEAQRAVGEEIKSISDGRGEFEKEREALTARLGEMRSALASLEAERRATGLAAAELEALREKITGDGDTRQNSIDELQQRNEHISEELRGREARVVEMQLRAEELRARISEITSKKLELEGERTRTDKAGQEKNRALLDMQGAAAKLEQKMLAADMEEKQILDRLWDTYELSHSTAAAIRAPIESVSKATRRVSELKREISSLGTPNVGAIEEYDRVSARYEFLAEQRDDVETAKKELLVIIEDVTRQMKDIFSREFVLINESFKETFLELFGGGRASLEIDDPSDVLESGITLRAQPPGKQLSNLSLLSGGESAFVAIALYFAILKVRPTPFCVMDEIEAALDEVNVLRFADYMRRMSDKTQFVVITHRRGTMEEADILYGVTMQEKGVSRVLSVDLDEKEITIA